MVSNNLKAGKSYKYFYPEDLEDADAKIWQVRNNIGATSPDSQVEFFPIADSSDVQVSLPANVILLFKEGPFYATDLVFQELVLTKVRQRQIAAITRIVVAIGARHMKHAGPTEGGETVGGSSGSSQLSTSGGPTEMINDRCPDANRKAFVKGVGENLPPTTQTRGL